MGRRSVRSVAFQVARHKQLREQILNVLGRKIQGEMKNLCSLLIPSVLRTYNPEAVQSFKWKTLIEEIKERAPTFYSVLANCAYKKPKKLGSKSYRIKDEVVIGTCASIFLRHRSCKMNMIQRIISMILYSNNAGKMVCNLTEF